MKWFRKLAFWKPPLPVLLEAPKGSYVENFSTSPTDFYTSVVEELTAMKVPDLDTSRVFFAEGGPLSPQREYLRMRRERLIFDVCAAPFGTSFFFSTRFAEIPLVLHFWQFLVVTSLLGAVGFAYWIVMGRMWGMIMFGLNVVGLFALLRNLVELRLHRLDDFLLQLPIFGAVYEQWFRPETYFRTDTRTMYIETIKVVVQRRIAQVTGQAGVQLENLEGLQPRELGQLAAALRGWGS